MAREMITWSGYVRDHTGWILPMIDIGGGWTFGKWYGTDPRTQIDDESAPDADEYARLCSREIQNEAEKLGLALPRLQLKPGRSLSGPSSVMVGTVGAVKQGDMKKWLNLDPPPTPSRGRPSSTRTSTRYRSPTLAERPKTIDLVAPLCNSRRDQPSQAMPSLERGDLVAFLETGGNLEPIAVRYNAQFPPATVLVCWDQAEVTTVRERLDDVVGRFRVPPRLRAASFHPS